MANWTPEAGRHAEDTRKTENKKKIIGININQLKSIENQMKFIENRWPTGPQRPEDTRKTRGRHAEDTK